MAKLRPLVLVSSINHTQSGDAGAGEGIPYNVNVLLLRDIA